MQITVKSANVLATGITKSGKMAGEEWRLQEVIASDDTRYTTFAKDAENLIPGTVITIENLDQDDKGWKFKKYEIIEAASIQSQKESSTSERAATNDGMTNDMWAEKQRIERSSIESQVAFKGIIATIGVEKPTDKLREAQEAALDWALPRLRPLTEAAPTKPEKDIEKLWPEEKPPEKTASLVDLDWLKKSMATLQDKNETAYSEDAMVSHMRATYKGIEGKTIAEIASNLDKGSAAHFTKTIKDSLAK